MLASYEMKQLSSNQGEILPSTPAIVKYRIAQDLKTVQTHQGCGDRICRICCFNSQRGVVAAPFSQIAALHNLKAQYSIPSISQFADRYRWLTHFVDNEPLHYFHEGHTYADVVRDAVQKELYVIIRTHGWLPDDEIADAAVQGIANLQTTFQKFITLEFSIDTYGFIDFTQNQYIEFVKRNLKRLHELGIDLTICAYHNPNDLHGAGSREALIDLLKRIDIPTNYVVQDYWRIYAEGRARNITPLPPRAGSAMNIGYTVSALGNLLVRQSALYKTLNLGSIYKSIDESVIPSRIHYALD